MLLHERARLKNVVVKGNSGQTNPLKIRCRHTLLKNSKVSDASDYFEIMKLIEV